MLDAACTQASVVCGAAWQVLSIAIVEGLDATIVRQQQENESRNRMAAKTMTDCGTLLAYAQPTAAPVLQHALHAVQLITLASRSAGFLRRGATTT